MTLVDPDAVETISVLGPTIQFITPPDICGDGPCVMRGTIPAGVVVPLHSHRDPRRSSCCRARSRIGAFFREIATPNGSWPPSPDALRHFLATAERYGYWNATPAENAAVGITL